MKNPFTLSIYFLVSALSFISCKEDGTSNPTIDATETLFTNGKIYTLNPSQPWAEAMLIRDGRITYVGDNTEAQNRASEGAEEIDLGGAFLMPGIHDVHQHPLEAATNNFQFVLDDTVDDPELYIDDILRAAEANPNATWLLGWGHWIDAPLSATRLPKEIIDDVVPDRPVAIMEQTSHSIWCNSKALSLLGVDQNTPNPPGGIIMREPNGEANGLLIDNAGNMLLNLALTPTPESAKNDYDGLLQFALPELAKYGITSICDARTYWKRNHHETWQQLADEGNLTVRVNLGLWAYPSEEDATQLSQLKTLFQNNENSLLKINQIKLYCDGIIHNTTAAMQTDYLVDYFNLPSNRGLNYFSQERIVDYIAALEPVGFDFHIHTIGNRGVHEALNAIEQSGSSMGRHRLTHVEYVDPTDVPRFAQLNVTADAQVAGDFTQPSHWHDNDYLIGPALNNNNVPLKSLTTAGARLTLSSDWDVSDLNPFIGLANAISRLPQEISLEEAVKAYTINAAYVMRQEEVVGSLEVGKEADFIVLDRNLFEIEVEDIYETQVLQTYLQGELIYEK